MIKHYLITVATFDGMYVHAYLMVDDKRYAHAVAEQMVDLAEENGLKPMGIILFTELSKGNGKPDPRAIKQVRDMLCRLDKKAEKQLRAAKGYHLSTFLMSEGHPDNAPLMKLH